VHWTHVVSTIILIVTGLFVFVPVLGEGVGKDALYIIRVVHRIVAVIFIAVPVVMALYKPKSFARQIKLTFAPWDEDDKTFLRRFIPYLFAPKKIHMPKQHETKSGQRVADTGLVLFALLISISGIILWAGKYVNPAIIPYALVLHDISFVMLSIVGLSHAYLGLGVFQPYRGMPRVMFGDGLISESDARYHWGYWAEEELASGEHVVEK
jgi:formate dehydrogenase subunit gamma